MSKYKKPVEVSIPESYDLGFCPINKVSEFPFKIFNPNAKSLTYLFKYTEFLISPAKGVLLPNTYANFKIEFKTKAAAVIVGTVVLEVEGQEQRVFKLSAVGKYPYIAVLTKEMDFGDVLVTKTASKELIIKNSSEVTAEFKINRAITGQFEDDFFSFTPERGSIPPRSSYAVQANFNPRFSDFKSLCSYTVACESGNEFNLSLKGDSTKFKVSFNSSSLNFGEVKLDSFLHKVVTLTNDSELDTEYQFFTDSNNVFCFNEIKGILPKLSYKKIVIEFRPRNTIAYYERVYCLVRSHVLLFVDLIGTCYDLLIRPIPLLQVHIDSFRRRVIEGRISAIQLKYVENNLLLKLAKRNFEDDQEEEKNFYQSNTIIKENIFFLHKELFQENDQRKLLCINQDFLEFGFCETMTLSGQRQIQITNNLECKLSLSWIIQKRENLNGEYMTVFNVFPETATLKPRVPVKFFITFRPLRTNEYYFQHLQFFATKLNPKITKKTLEEFEFRQLKAKPEASLLRTIKFTQTIQAKVKEDVEGTEVLPPFSGIVRCVGHSFNSASVSFQPIMKILPSSKITFKPSQKHHSVYESVQLINQSDTSIYFKIGPDPQRVFRTYPKLGLIEPKNLAIIVLEFTPREYKLYKSSISVYLNDLPGTKISLMGVCTEPEIKLENEGKIYFAPTFTGVCTKKTYSIQNISKSRVTYSITVPEKYQEQLSFEPKEKTLDANELFSLNLFFVPHFKRVYKIIVPVEVVEDCADENLHIGYHMPGSASVAIEPQMQTKKTYQLEINGEGSDGIIKISENQLDFKTVKITEQKKMQFKLSNSSNCAFYVELHLRNNNFEPGASLQSHINSVFNLDFKEGIIPANSQISVGVMFSPTDAQNYDLRLVVSAEEKVPKGTTLRMKGNESCSKCQMRILAQANYPLLEIIDIRNDTLSVAALWQNFQISRINHELNCKLDANERKFLTVEKLTFSEAKSLEQDLKHYEWNLGYVSTKSKAKPRKVIITVCNFGGTPLDYSFKFPSDNKVREQLWADPGEPSQQEAYEKAILENNIFQISPRVGRLEAKEVKDIELIYSPISLQNMKMNGSSNEEHLLKVVFQIQNGKSLVFNLKGTTLGPNEGLLTVKKSHYILPDTPIGLMEALHFPIEVNNVGSIKVNYKTEIQYEPGQFPEVFQIQNPAHFLMSGQNHYIYCLYKPLIEKVYNFKILIRVFDVIKQIQTIELNIKGQATRTINSTVKNEVTRVIPGQRTMVSQIGSKVFFSIQEIDFEAMRAGEVKYNMVILYNMSKEHALNFDFSTQSTIASKEGLTCNDKFSIQPSQGILQANKFIQLKITLAAGSSPSFYEGEIPCNIVWAHNKYVSEDNDFTQKDIMLSSQKESLFLRIKKSSLLTTKHVASKVLRPQMADNRRSLIDHIFHSIINSALNDPSLDEIIEQLGHETTPLLDTVATSPPVAIEKINAEEPVQDEEGEKRDYSNYECMLLSQQFQEIAQVVMENTFFNIVQETTHQQNDFLRVGKKFIQAHKL